MGVSFNIMCPNSSIYSDEKSRVLVDKTKSGKVRPWREKKIANVDYFERFCCKVKNIANH